MEDQNKMPKPQDLALEALRELDGRIDNSENIVQLLKAKEKRG